MTNINTIRDITFVANYQREQKRRREEEEERLNAQKILAKLQTYAVLFCENEVDNLIAQAASEGKRTLRLPMNFSSEETYCDHKNIRVCYPLYVDGQYADGTDSETPDKKAAPISLELVKNYLQDYGYEVEVFTCEYRSYGIGWRYGRTVQISW